MQPNLYKHPSFTHADNISYLCEPLKKLNINYFSHVKIDHKNQFSTLSSNPEFFAHYLTNKYFTADIHVIDKKQFGDFFVWDAMQFSDHSTKVCVEASYFKVHNPFTIIQKRKDSTHYYHFASAIKDKRINQVYIANIDLLNLFIAYFTDHVKQSTSLSKAYDFKLSAASERPIFSQDKTIVLDRKEFYESLKIDRNAIQKLYFKEAALSKRQSEILHYIIRGKTLKEISHILKLSHRTVGHYFEMLKMKLNVQSKSELIAKTMDADSIKLLEEK